MNLLIRIYRFKSGKVVIILAGRFAGRKAVVVKASDEGSHSSIQSHTHLLIIFPFYSGNDKVKYGHAIVAGIDRYPRKIVKAMSGKKVEKRSKIRPFIKSLNLSHIMPTRYTVDFDLKKSFDESALANADSRTDSKKKLKKMFEEKYKSQNPKDKKAAGVSYFFNKLRF